MPSAWDNMQNQNVAMGADGEPMIQVPTTPEQAQEMGYSPDQYQQVQSVLHQGADQQMPVSMQQHAQDLAKTYDLKHRELLASQQAGVKGLENQINQYAQQPTEYDTRPLMNLAEMFASGNGYAQMGHAPSETKAQRDQKILALREGLQQRKEALTKGQMEGLKEQLSAYRSMQPKETTDLDKRLKEAQIFSYYNNAEAKNNPKTTDSQATSAGFARRAEQAEGVFKNLASQGYDRASRVESIKASKLVPAEFEGEDLKKQSQAERNFLNSILRKESGAVISDEEFASGEQQYFPRPGDTPDIKAQKEANRLQATENLKFGAGKNYKNLPLVQPQQDPRLMRLQELRKKKQGK